ncbi:MAG: hypothetical protein V1816_03630 [Pseudomonadota bacterium]
MSGPVHMNQVISQTPTVEKIHHTEQQQPDQQQRFASVEQQIQTRVRSETVQSAPKTEQQKKVERENRKKEERRRKGQAALAAAEEDIQDSPAKTDRADGAGTIVDVII